MSDDALAALLHECPNLYEVGEETVPAACEGDYRLSAAWLRARGVVVLPPAVAEVLRTGEPSEAQAERYLSAIGITRDMSSKYEDWEWVMGIARRTLRAALAVLREPT